MKPMLAFHYKDHEHKVKFPQYVQPKLNGLRMLYHAGVMQSRSYGQEEEITWAQDRLVDLRKELSVIPPHLILDGEIYIHGWSLQRINSAAAVRALADKETTFYLQYHVFDVVDTTEVDMGFGCRRYLFLPETQRVKMVETVRVMTKEEGDSWYRTFKSRGYEGMMYRAGDQPYGFVEQCGNKENRWKHLLKRKDHLDGEYTIIDVQIGEGKFSARLGSLVVEDADARVFNVGTGFTDAERTEYWNSPPLGRVVRVRYDSLSDAGIPLQPRFECLID